MKETYGSLLFFERRLNNEETKPDENRQRHPNAYVEA
jgi:hypothetical protein